MTDIVEVSEPPVRGHLHRPKKSGGRGLVLTHGAGSNCESLLLKAIANAFAEAGFSVLRCDLPFRQAKRFGPPFPAQAKADQSGLKSAAQFLRSSGVSKVILGGHSYGGRQASLLCAADGAVAEGLVLFSYPLHSPKRPEDLRTAHFPALQVRSLFVHGSRDPFGSIAEMQEAIRLIAGRTGLIELAGLGHDLGNGRFDMGRIVQDVAEI